MSNHDFILLDRSGSMQSMWVEAISSINSYVHQLDEKKVDTGVTVITFDRDQGVLKFEVIRDKVSPATWMPISKDEIHPRGSTPLWDAAARMVSLARAGGYDKVAAIFMTDGAENASEEVNLQQVKGMLDDCRKKDWQVIFLGANFDNASQALSLGANSSQFVQTSSRNFAATMDSLAVSRAAYGASGQAMGFTDEEKRDLKQP